jgi:hypothetical protein
VPDLLIIGILGLFVLAVAILGDRRVALGLCFLALDARFGKLIEHVFYYDYIIHLGSFFSGWATGLITLILLTFQYHFLEANKPGKTITVASIICVLLMYHGINKADVMVSLYQERNHIKTEVTAYLESNNMDDVSFVLTPYARRPDSKPCTLVSFVGDVVELDRTRLQTLVDKLDSQRNGTWHEIQCEFGRSLPYRDYSSVEYVGADIQLHRSNTNLVSVSK